MSFLCSYHSLKSEKLFRRRITFQLSNYSWRITAWVLLKTDWVLSSGFFCHLIILQWQHMFWVLYRYYFNLSNHPMFPFYRWGNWGKQVNKLSQGHTASKYQMRLNQTLVPESTYPSEFFEWQVTEAQLKLARQKGGFVSSQNQFLKRTGRERLSETMETEFDCRQDAPLLISRCSFKLASFTRLESFFLGDTLLASQWKEGSWPKSPIV